MVMTNVEKMNLLEEALELDANSLTGETKLEDIEEYDSMGKLSLIVMCDDEFDKKLSGEQISEFKTVKDILDFLG
jgi:acyl carrier protein